MYSTTPSTSAKHVFAYGTLVDPRCLEDVIGHQHLGERLAARLEGYSRVTSESYPYPYIVEAGDAAVDGVLVMDLSALEILALDRYEEVDSGIYRRELVEVEAWGSGPRLLRLQAFAYIAGPALLGSTAS
jgi:gamma-glutamylcyclotransferase (GGCT)/AIG2-like uncharacterized protein YtfP